MNKNMVIKPVKRCPVVASVFLLLAVISLLMLPACNMTASDNPFGSLANGASLPAEYAIASGNPKLMYECLQERRNLLNSGNLTDRQRAEVALDMIDLLAVLSRIIVSLVPYIMDGAPPTALISPEDFISSESIVTLSEIGESDLMDYSYQYEPSPLQLLWAVLGFVAYLIIKYPAPLTADDISDEDYLRLMQLAQYLEDAGVEIDDKYLSGVISQLIGVLEGLDPMS